MVTMSKLITAAGAALLLAACVATAPERGFGDRTLVPDGPVATPAAPGLAPTDGPLTPIGLQAAPVSTPAWH